MVGVVGAGVDGAKEPGVAVLGVVEFCVPCVPVDPLAAGVAALAPRFMAGLYGPTNCWPLSCEGS